MNIVCRSAALISKIIKDIPEIEKVQQKTARMTQLMDSAVHKEWLKLQK